MTKLAINGLGRIGRAVLKIAVREPALEVVAVNDLAPVDQLAYLLRHDSVFGAPDEPVEAGQGTLVWGDTVMRCLQEKDPECSGSE